MKKVNSTVLVVFSMALVSILCLLLGASYSYILSNGSAANTETINTGNLNANITINKVEYDKMTASADSDGMASANYATVKIEKNNNYSVYYQLNLEYTSTASESEINTYLPLENLEVALYKVTDGQTGDSPVMGPIRVADLPIVKCEEETDSDLNSILKSQYQLYIAKLASDEASVEYALKAWIASDTDEEFNGRQVLLDLTVNQSPYYSKSTYNLSFDIASGSGAELYLNGVKADYAYKNGNYTYSLSNVVEGIYTLTVKKSSKTYETTLEINTGDTVEVKSLPSEVKEQDVGKSLQKIAYDNKTTVYQIMKKNLSIQNSNVLTQYKLYNMPTSYQLTAKPSLDVQTISGIKITLNDSTNDMSLSYTASSTISLEDGNNIFESMEPTMEIEGGVA